MGSIEIEIADLARVHTAGCLVRALDVRLRGDGHPTMLTWAPDGQHQLGGPLVASAYVAEVLLAKLRGGGSGELADAVVSTLRGGGIEPSAGLRAQSIEGETAASLRTLLCRRLRADGHLRLAKAIEDRFVAHASAEPSRPEEPAEQGRALPEEMRLRPLADAEIEHRVALADANSARVLLGALVSRLRTDHREALAGWIACSWLSTVTGPIVDSRWTLRAMIAALRSPPVLPPHMVGLLPNEASPALADEVEALVGETIIDRSVDEIVRGWFEELAGPLFQVRELAAALVAGLRLEEALGKRPATDLHPVAALMVKELHFGLRGDVAEDIARLLSASPGLLGIDAPLPPED